MTPEKQTKTPSSQRQKIMIAVTVIIMLFVGWQVIGMFGGGGGTVTAPAPAPSPSPPKAMSSTSPAATTAIGTPPKTVTTPTGAASPLAALPLPQSNTPVIAAVTPNPVVQKIEQKSETQYLTAISDLQLLKLQQQIDETKQAIATAKLNTVTAEKNVADLLTTKPSERVGPGGPPAVSGPTGPPPQEEANQGPAAGLITPPPVQAAPEPPPEIPYNVLSVSYVNKWSAVIKGPAKMYNVHVGDTLPDDGAEVVGISKEGVMLKKPDKTLRKLLIANPI